MHEVRLCSCFYRIVHACMCRSIILPVPTLLPAHSYIGVCPITCVDVQFRTKSIHPMQWCSAGHSSSLKQIFLLQCSWSYTDLSNQLAEYIVIIIICSYSCFLHPCMYTKLKCPIIYINTSSYNYYYHWCKSGRMKDHPLIYSYIPLRNPGQNCYRMGDCSPPCTNNKLFMIIDSAQNILYYEGKIDIL